MNNFAIRFKTNQFIEVKVNESRSTWSYSVLPDRHIFTYRGQGFICCFYRRISEQQTTLKIKCGKLCVEYRVAKNGLKFFEKLNVFKSNLNLESWL